MEALFTRRMSEADAWLMAWALDEHAPSRWQADVASLSMVFTRLPTLPIGLSALLRRRGYDTRSPSANWTPPVDAPMAGATLPGAALAGATLQGATLPAPPRPSTDLKLGLQSKHGVLGGVQREDGREVGRLGEGDARRVHVHLGGEE